MQPDFLPDKHESGTPNTPGIAGLGAALGVIETITVDAIREKQISVGEQMLAGLGSIQGVTLRGPHAMADNVGVFSLTVEGADPAEIAAELEDRYGIMTRVGLQCAPSAHRAIGTYPEGTIRASIGYYTTEAEIRHFLHSLGRVCHA
jgi:selenocysteine lyase/cysteine desulfurase